MVEATKWSFIAKGLTLSLVYCLAYLAAWFLSLDQWFLPAGVRIAGFLLLPSRYWPFLLLGDVSALLLIRVPRAPFDGELWAYASPFLLAPMAAALPAIARKRFKTLERQINWLPLICLTASLWSFLCNMLTNLALFRVESSFSVDKTLTYVVGYYLGMLLVTLPCQLFLLQGKSQFPIRHLLKHSLISSGIISALFAAIVVPDHLDDGLQLGLLILMITPAIALTLLHGWRGAAIGIVISNLAIGLTLQKFNAEAAHDSTAFAGQLALVIAATGLLLLGSVISKHYEKARQCGLAEQEALKLAQSSFLSTEKMLREKLLYMAQMQLLLDRQRHTLAEEFKNGGRHLAAMKLNNSGVTHRRAFDEQALALYPIRIEEVGLFAAVHNPDFTEHWAGDAGISYGFRGPVKKLSLDLQLTAFRCICYAMDVLSQYQPDEYRINMRAWHGQKRRGIVFYVSAVPTAPFEQTSEGAAAETLIETRVKAHGGNLRRHAHKFSVLLCESVNPESIIHRPASSD